MTSTLTARDDVGSLDAALNDALAAGRLLTAYTTYYDEAALTGSLQHVPRPDRDRTRVLRFFRWAERFHRAAHARSAASTRVSRSEWVVPDPGPAGVLPARRVVTRHWRRGRVVAERVEHAGASCTQE